MEMADKEEIAVPPSLYKYCSTHGANLIKDLKFKVTPPIQFNDPFELSPYLGKPTSSDHIKNVLEAITLEEVHQDMLKAGEKLPPFDEFVKSVNSMAPMLERHAGPAFDVGYRQLAATELRRFSEELGIVCLSERENDPLMWSHYTDCHKGMVIEFDTAHEYFQNNSKFLKVHYTDERVPFDPDIPVGSAEESEFAQKLMTTKQTCWSYETEWRSLFPLHGCEKRPVNGTNLYFSDIPPDLIRRVILGCRVSEDTMRVVCDARRRPSMAFSVYKAVIHEREFRLVYEKL
jgi:hypothetical protein